MKLDGWHIHDTKNDIGTRLIQFSDALNIIDREVAMWQLGTAVITSNIKLPKHYQYGSKSMIILLLT